MTRRVVEKLCTKKSLRCFFGPYYWFFAPTAEAEMTEKEQQLHNSFGMLFAKVGDMFDKFGAKKFEPEIGEAYDATRLKL